MFVPTIVMGNISLTLCKILTLTYSSNGVVIACIPLMLSIQFISYPRLTFSRVKLFGCHSHQPLSPILLIRRKKPLSTKRSADQLTPDFVSNKPLFELISAPQTEKAVFLKFASSSPAGTRVPILQNPDGKSALICLSSSVGAPFNKCNLI